MNHVGTQCIETERLILRRFELSDTQSMFDNIASDDEVTRFLSWPDGDVSVMEKILADWIDQYSQPDRYNWGIVLKENGPEAIGNIIVFDWDEADKVPELGCCLGRRWWDRGIMTEALGAVIDFLFNEVGVQRIVGRHDVNNPRSGSLMRKCGMTHRETRDGYSFYDRASEQIRSDT